MDEIAPIVGSTCVRSLTSKVLVVGPANNMGPIHPMN